MLKTLKDFIVFTFFYCILSMAIEYPTHYYYRNYCTSQVTNHNLYIKSLLVSNFKTCNSQEMRELVYESASYTNRGITNPYSLVSFPVIYGASFIDSANEQLADFYNIAKADLDYKVKNPDEISTRQVDYDSLSKEKIKIFQDHWRPIVKPQNPVPPIIWSDPYDWVDNVKMFLYILGLLCYLRKKRAK